MTSYVYKWTHLPTMMWYIGSRTAKGCHPLDGYICSSKVVKPMILEHKNEWKREVVAVGTTEEMLELETEILNVVDAKNDSRSFNLHNGDGKFSVSGKKVGPQSAAHKKALGESKKGIIPWNKGKKETRPDVLNKMSIGHVGKQRAPHTEDTKNVLLNLRNVLSKPKNLQMQVNYRRVHNVI